MPLKEKGDLDMNYSPLRYPGGKSKIAPFISLIIEKIKGRPLDDKVIEKISSVFFTLLIILMVFIVFNDITLLIKK